MARIDPIPLDKMNAHQRRLRDEIASHGRGVDRGPFSVLLHAPEIAEPIAGFVEHFLSDTRVPHTCKEIAILAIARRYRAQYEWFVHERRCRQLGVADAVIEAIRAGRRPDFADPAEGIAYDMAAAMVDDRKLGDDLYARAVETFGKEAVVELVAQIGFYIAIAVVLVAYDVEAPDGAVPLPA